MRRTITVEIDDREWAGNAALRNALYQTLDNFERDLRDEVFPHALQRGSCRTLGAAPRRDVQR
jgi:hypothetical protein